MATALDTDTRPEDRFISAFEVNHGEALNGTSASMAQQREQAIARFAELGLPTNKLEAYKYTNIAKVLDRPYTMPLGSEAPSVAPDDITPFLIDDLDAHRLVLVNGRLDASLSDVGALPDGVVVSGLADAGAHNADLVDAHYGRYADSTDEALTALNTAFAQDGAFVYVPRGTMLDKPVFVLHLNAGAEDAFVQPRQLFVVEEGGAARVIEAQYSLTEARTFTNTVTEAFVGARGNLDHYVLQDEGAHASQVHTLAAAHNESSIFDTHTVTLSGEVVRNNLTLTPDGAHCETHLFGLLLGRGTMHIDNHTLVDHVHADCFSNELYKNILDESATGVFNGKVFVRPDSQRINAYQSNKSVVLTDEAEIYAKPELEIYADDVQCSHGATTGQLDKEGLFYLRSRGLSEYRARVLMLQAFAQDVIDEIKDDTYRAFVTERVRQRFAESFA
ncbi:Fe-S cluster assembly protein SufD [Salisaeta longa]|uniref:Fe-S cluster assembly protein SufD n=1 Tax=Salisaeta longa TaxID=503170 RepID=UPI0003B47AC2|nr:Fe-S cluster assembly protein SufD [Salisaeta longa]